jgi:hypothetical protein
MAKTKWLVTDTDVSDIDSESVALGDKIPNKYYMLTQKPFRGFVLEFIEPNFVEKKIYGKSQVIADHILDAYSKIREEQNLGVLFSGGKGLGKSLTTKILAKTSVEKHPVIFVNSYIDGMTDFLAKVRGSVIIIDEFEKIMRGAADGDDGDGVTKQEKFLSLLDGTAGANGNLFILTCNDRSELNENLISRPGRIRYHYKFSSLGIDEIKAYCEDNLKDKSKEEGIIEELLSANYVSHDILIALVNEINEFGCSAEEAMEYLNVEGTSIVLDGVLVYDAYGKEYTVEINEFEVKPRHKSNNRWVNLEYSKSRMEAAAKAGALEGALSSDDDECVIDDDYDDGEEREEDIKLAQVHLNIDFTNVKLKYFDEMDVTKYVKIYNAPKGIKIKRCTFRYHDALSKLA